MQSKCGNCRFETAPQSCYFEGRPDKYQKHGAVLYNENGSYIIKGRNCNYFFNRELPNNKTIDELATHVVIHNQVFTDVYVPHVTQSFDEISRLISELEDVVLRIVVFSYDKNIINRILKECFSKTRGVLLVPDVNIEEEMNKYAFASNNISHIMVCEADSHPTAEDIIDLSYDINHECKQVVAVKGDKWFIINKAVFKSFHGFDNVDENNKPISPIDVVIAWAERDGKPELIKYA